MKHKAICGIILLAFGMIVFFTSTQPAYSCDPYRETDIQKYWAEQYASMVRPWDGKDFDWKVIAKAQPDECFFKLGDSNNLASFLATYPGNLSTGYGACSFGGETGTPKVNQAYVWGLTHYKKDIWFGTIANTLCLVMGSMGMTSPFKANTFACEGGFKDARPPRIFLYDTKAKQLFDMTALIPKGSVDYGILTSTIGLRSAGQQNGVVFLGGISRGGVAMFAFDAENRSYIGSILYNGQNGLPAYSNIRQWIVANGELYVGVASGVPQGLFANTQGDILRWIGDVNNPFVFETVGHVPGDPAYLVKFNDRLYANTWGGPAGSYGTVLSMSPKMKDDKILTAADADNWTTVWQYSNYEVEASASMAGGAIAAFDGWLYFTTMLPPGAQLQQFQQLYPTAPNDAQSVLLDFLGSYRPTAMFRGKGFASGHPTIELLYGNYQLPKYDAGNNSWKLVPNNLAQVPKYGLAGYNNMFNSYTWWIHNYKGEMFVGTFDWSYLLGELIFDQYASKIPPEVIATARQFEGADLLRFTKDDQPGYPVRLNGVGNYSNYGVRTMITLDGNLYIGTANPFNLFTDPAKDPYGKTGGWELIKLWLDED